MASPAIAEEVEGCLLEVEGTTYIEGPCDVEVLDENTTILRGPDVVYFVYLDTAGDISTWNEEAGAGHAHTQLGVLKQEGDCWVNDTARVCYGKEEEFAPASFQEMEFDCRTNDPAMPMVPVCHVLVYEQWRLFTNHGQDRSFCDTNVFWYVADEVLTPELREGPFDKAIDRVIKEGGVCRVLP